MGCTGSKLIEDAKAPLVGPDDLALHGTKQMTSGESFKPTSSRLRSVTGHVRPPGGLVKISEHGQNDATTGTRDPAAVGPGPSGKVEPDGRTSSREEKNRFDHVTKTVAELFRCPIVVVCLGDSAPRRYVTQRGAIDLAGVDWGPLPKLRETCVVEDASRAPAWADNPLVTGRPAMRFVAAAPVAPHGDVPVGALLVIDTVARPPEHGQPKVLASFADIIAAELAREDWVQALLSQVDAKRRQSIAASRADGQSRLRFAVDAYSAPCALVCTRAGGWSIAHYNQEWRDLFSMPKIAHRGPTEGRSASRIAQDPLATAVSAPIRRQLTADVSSRASAGLGIPPLHPRKGEPSDGGAASDAGAGLSALGSTVGVVSGDGSSGGAPFWSVLEPAERDASAEEKAHEASIAAQQPFRVAVHARKRRQKSGPPVVCVFKPTHDTNEVDMIEGASVSSPTTGGTLFFVTVEDDGAGQRETAPGDGYAPAGMLAPVAPFVDVKLGRLIGKGGYGEVYRGLWDGAPVAVKIMRHAAPEGEEDTEEIQCQFEAVVSVNIAHPNLVQSFKFSSRPCVDDPSKWETWVVQEYCDRGNLQEGCDKRHYIGSDGEPDVPLILSILREVAGAICHLHSRGIIHGDLSANNVMLTSSPLKKGYTAKVGDFGLAKTVGDIKDAITLSKFGTPTHMPPELLREGRFCAKCDIWSIGVLIWQMWTCERPWAGMSPQQVVAAVGFDGRRLPEPEGMHAGLRVLLNDCLAPDMDDRPSIEDVLARVMAMQKNLKRSTQHAEDEEAKRAAEAFLLGEG